MESVKIGENRNLNLLVANSLSKGVFSMHSSIVGILVKYSMGNTVAMQKMKA